MRLKSAALAAAALLLLLVSACAGGDSPATTPAGALATSAASAVTDTASTASTTTGSPSAAATSGASATTPGGTTKAAPTHLGSPTGVAVTQAAPDFTALPGAKAIFGKLGNSVYRIEMPDSWNGDLVLWAHGFNGFGTEVSVQGPPNALRSQWVTGGYAWAASSFSENGYTPGIGADDTLALKQYFEQQYGKAKHTYIVGSSMGGNVVSLSLENYGAQYDGGYSMCGAVAGESEIDYLTSWTALAEYISGLTFPIGEGAAKMTPVLLQDIPRELGTATNPTAKGKAFQSAIRNLTGGPRPYFVEGFQAQFTINFGLLLLDPDRKTLPGSAGTNDGVTYHIDSGFGFDDATLNAMIRRLHADPASRNALAHPDAVPASGNLQKPLLTIHGTGDLYVPISQEQLYRKAVDAAGKSDLLVQRAIRDKGHCAYSDPELTTGFSDMVKWVTTGEKPAGDNLLGDLTDIGRQFTNPIRTTDPGTK